MQQHGMIRINVPNSDQRFQNPWIKIPQANDLPYLDSGEIMPKGVFGWFRI